MAKATMAVRCWRIDRRVKPAGGFTLLEVLVAVTVLAITLAAIIEAVTRYTDNATYLRERTFAHWVADNRITELRLGEEWPDPGVRRGTEALGGREWHWTLRIEATADDDVRRVEAMVQRTADATGHRARVTGFVERPL